MEATPDPLLGNIGGAEITFGLEDDGPSAATTATVTTTTTVTATI